MRHVGILAHSIEGATLCFRTFCQEGFRELGPHDHPDVTLDAIAMARSMPSWETGDHAAIREILAARGCDAVALVCTEIQLLVAPENSPLSTLDSTRLLARAAFAVALGRAPLPAWRGGPVGP